MKNLDYSGWPGLLRTKLKSWFKSDRLKIGLFFLFLAILFSWPLLGRPGLIGLRHDWSIPVFDLDYFLSLGGSAWTKENLGHSRIFGSIYLFDLAFGLLGLIGINGALLSKILLVASLTVAGFGGFYLASQLGLSLLPAAISGWLYLASPILFDKLTAGQHGYFLAYALAPYFLGLVDRFLVGRKPRLSQLLWPAFLFALIAGQLQFLAMASIASYLVSARFGFRRWLCLYLKIVGLSAIFMLPWLTLLFLNRGAVSDLAGGATSLSWLAGLSSSLFDSLQLTTTANPYFVKVASEFNFLWPASFLLVGSLFGLVLGPKKRVLPIGLLLLIGIFLAKGTYPPLGGIYSRAIQTLPYLASFREVSHWLFLPTLAAVLLFAFFVSRIIEARNRSLIVSSSLIILGLLWYSWPYLSGGLSRELQVFNPLPEYKRYYFEQVRGEDRTRVFYLPSSKKTHFAGLAHAGADPFILGSKKPALAEEGNIISTADPSTAFRNFLQNELQLAPLEEAKKSFQPLLSLADISAVNLKTRATDDFPAYSFLRHHPEKARVWDMAYRLERLNELFKPSQRRQLGSLLVYEIDNRSKKFRFATRPVFTTGGREILRDKQYDAVFFAYQVNRSELSAIKPTVESSTAEAWALAQAPKDRAFELSELAKRTVSADEGFIPGHYYWWYDRAFSEIVEPFVVSFSDDSLRFDLSPGQGPENLLIKYLAWPEGGEIKIKIGQETKTLSTKAQEKAWRVLDLGPVEGLKDQSLKAEISVSGGKNAIARLALVDQAEIEKGREAGAGSLAKNLDPAGLGTLADRSQEPEVEVLRSSLTKYTIRTKTVKPFYLIFSESYHPGWRLIGSAGQELKPIMVDSFAQAYPISDLSEQTWRLEFLPQRAYRTSLLIALAALTVTVGLQIGSRFRLKKSKTEIS